MAGRLIAVVGPSGVGKDSVMRAMAERRPDLHLVRRVITRTPDAGGEDFDPVSEEAFAARAARGEFALHWRAHGLCYGVPAGVVDVLDDGRDALVNLSRTALPEAAEKFRGLKVLALTAAPEVLARRLAARGRESEAEIAGRLARAGYAIPGGLDVIEVVNNGPLAQTAEAALAALYPAVRA
ncbi:ribose 1,5-bisphosphokinase [Salinihabitans flavidus]|uniref:Ribose 1,5-bisphosphate phosphokinase PhnN n=1 Tax=Salinihabitans flavidus TaxID=569882 RepID=A0A1H8QXH6_9RHOB|nr:phosphonate metabolism protein/1,5-bisphosphokinase (PRPP-forming) PhnN [Salinihabitans flavidus]SEO58413.1 ribose 1,5-bisphosphokinase [Salinihabitans flavidus]